MANATVKTEVVADFEYQDEGTIKLLRPLTEAGQEWIDQHIPNDALRFCGAVVIEHRFISDILFGIHNDGLAVR